MKQEPRSLGQVGVPRLLPDREALRLRCPQGRPAGQQGRCHQNDGGTPKSRPLMENSPPREEAANALRTGSLWKPGPLEEPPRHGPPGATRARGAGGPA